jgi:Uma2 family endonuclease
MAAPKIPTIYTPEELLAISGDRLYELVDGGLLEKDMGGKSSWVGGQIFYYLSSFVGDAQIGWVFPADASYQCFPDDPERVRLPDVSLILKGRLPGEQVPDGHIPVPPDLAVEVVSPNDSFSEVREKAEEYLRAGVRRVWLVDPGTRTIEILGADGFIALLRDGDEIGGEPVLPGFRCGVGDFFATELESAAQP